MKNEPANVKCPQCGTPIDVTEILHDQMYAQLSQEINTKFNQERKALEQKNRTLEKEKIDIQKLKLEIDNSIATGIKQKLIIEKSLLEKQIRNRVMEEKSEELKSYIEQLDEKSKEVKHLYKLKAENQKIQREKLELKDKIEAEAELQITTQVEQERKKIRKDVEAKSELLIAEKEHVIKQLKTQLMEASRKADQGSSQLRGEVMETNLEDYLRQCFPMDTIEEIKKGAKGADILHFVHSTLQQLCGSIYYETKRAKDFQASWIQKFKADMLARKADIGVLVTEVYPKDTERLSFKDGIWICSLDEAKGLCFVLRQGLILLSEAKEMQMDKGGKMEFIYKYMISNEFRMQMEAIVGAFTTLQTNLLSEKRAMEAIWKQRQKEIEKVILNATHIYSSIRGIVGNAVKPIKQLDLPAPEENGTPSRKISLKS